MKVALVQVAAGLDKAENLRSVHALVSEAAQSRPDLVVLPEAVMHDFGPTDSDLAAVAEPLDGPFVSALAALAKAHGTAIVAGMFEATDGLPYNTVVALDGSGDLTAAYRKVHLYDSFGYRESDRLTPGPLEAVTVDVADARIGVMTCYDLRFPEIARLLVDAGATVLAVPAAWVRGPLKESHWDTLLRARAIENTVYVAAAAQCGSAYCGRSTLIDPLGVTVSGLGEQRGVAVGDVDPRRIADVRASNPALLHRRWRVDGAP